MTSCCRYFPIFKCRPGRSEYSGNMSPEYPFSPKSTSSPSRKPRSLRCLFSLVMKITPNFVRQLSTKARRNRRNIRLSKVVAATRSTSNVPPLTAAAVDISSKIAVNDEDLTVVNGDGSTNTDGVQLTSLTTESKTKTASFLTFDDTIAVHAGGRLGRDITTDVISTPVVKEGRNVSFEYEHYENLTSAVAEEKISALEGAESTLPFAYGMCVTTVMLMALIQAGGHIVTSTDCYRKARTSIEAVLSKMGIKYVIPPAFWQQSCEIFISHRGPDTKNNVSGLLHLRLSREFRVFLDIKNIKPGDYWLEKIDMYIRECKIGIVVFSPGYCDSYVCLHELALLMECKKKVIPIFCDVKPPELRVRDDGSCSPKDLQRYRWAIEEAKRISGITFDTAEGDWPQLIDDSSDAVKNLLEVEERD